MRVSEVHAAESVAYLNRAQVRLQEIWEEIGIPEEQRLQRTKDVHKHIKEEDGCTMLQMEKNSRTRLEVMREHKKQRMEELKALVAKDRELCDIMCTSPFCIDQECVPSLTQLEKFRTYLENLTKEKERRHNEFVSVKKEIITCMEDLERQPETSFEMDVMCEDEEAFCLSDDNIDALKQLLSQLQQRKTENELHCSTLRTKIQELWDRLKIPQEEREALNEHMAKSKRKNVEALQVEVQRLEELKLQSMKSVIEVVRVELALLWQKCFYSLEQQQAFPQYHHDHFTEDLLNLHEAEVTTLKKYFEEHKELFEGVSRWQDNWTLYLELDKKANDPTRFNNRGGNLLKEEKQRSDLQKSLPKLEKTLKAQIDIWEQQHGKEFLINGQKFLEYVEQQWAQHHTEKEKEKMERQMKKSKQTQEDMLYGTAVRTPSKRRLGGTPTPGKMRKINGTSSISTPNSFLSSGLGGTMCQSSIQKPPLSASKGVGLRTPGHARTPRALDRNKENLSHLTRNTPGGPLRPQDAQDHTFTLNSIAGSYTEFARDLSKASKSNVKSGHLNSTISHQ